MLYLRDSGWPLCFRQSDERYQDLVLKPQVRKGSSGQVVRTYLIRCSRQHGLRLGRLCLGQPGTLGP